MAARDAMVALKRFGLGPRPDQIVEIRSDPRGYLQSCLADPKAALITDARARPGHELFATDQERTRAVTQVRRKERGVNVAKTDPEEVRRLIRHRNAFRRTTYSGELDMRIAHGRKSDPSFLERLVIFWSNHFCVSAARAKVNVVAGAFEREAIRPHVLGRFSDMLLAVARHPAMLIYLDNRNSIGPNSVLGKRGQRQRGLNENLARELLELHTLGVDGGYTQEDVTNLARLITGWGIARGRPRGPRAGEFEFDPRKHEPGKWKVLGRSYGDTGEQSGRAVLQDMARHPATARHIARKLAMHFVSANPPAGLVARLERVFLDTDGSLKALAEAMIQADEAWTPPAVKFLPPYDYLVGLLRAFPELGYATDEFIRIGRDQGQYFWRPASPKGWPLGDNVWAGPAALSERIRSTDQLLIGLARSHDPRAAANALFGETMSAETVEAIALAETRQQGLVLLAMSPEFQRR